MLRFSGFPHLDFVNYQTSMKGSENETENCGVITFPIHPPILIPNDVGRIKFNSIIGTCFNFKLVDCSEGSAQIYGN